MEDENPQHENSPFDCPEEGCCKSFLKHGNLLGHLLIGNHQLIPQRHCYAISSSIANLFGKAGQLLKAKGPIPTILCKDGIFTNSNFNQ
uniref:C2H2-type domain-containing protein n=1 Tax=Romanomermis culicivorax TaxID=13658 RepID=A0A915L5S0_ROMCU